MSDYTNIYDMGKVKLGTWRHISKPTCTEIVVNWDGIVATNNIINLRICWMMECTNQYDDVVADIMS